MSCLMMCGVFVGMEQLEMVMALIKVQLRAEREVAVAGVTGMAPGRELFTHLWMHSAYGTCPASDVLLETSDCHLQRYVEELQINSLSLLCFKFFSFALPCMKLNVCREVNLLEWSTLVSGYFDFFTLSIVNLSPCWRQSGIWHLTAPSFDSVWGCVMSGGPLRWRRISAVDGITHQLLRRWEGGQSGRMPSLITL